jgi:hypothetical protein
LLLVLLPLLMTAFEAHHMRSSHADPVSCVGWPTEIAPRSDSSSGVRQYLIKNRCSSDAGRVALFLFCDGKKGGFLILDAGEEKTWSCAAGPSIGPGVLSINPMSVR